MLAMGTLFLFLLGGMELTAIVLGSVRCPSWLLGLRDLACGVDNCGGGGSSLSDGSRESVVLLSYALLGVMTPVERGTPRLWPGLMLKPCSPTSKTENMLHLCSYMNVVISCAGNRGNA